MISRRLGIHYVHDKGAGNARQKRIVVGLASPSSSPSTELNALLMAWRLRGGGASPPPTRRRVRPTTLYIIIHARARATAGRVPCGSFTVQSTRQNGCSLLYDTHSIRPYGFYLLFLFLSFSSYFFGSFFSLSLDLSQPIPSFEFHIHMYMYGCTKYRIINSENFHNFWRQGAVVIFLRENSVFQKKKKMFNKFSLIREKN